MKKKFGAYQQVTMLLSPLTDWRLVQGPRRVVSFTFVEYGSLLDHQLTGNTERRVLGRLDDTETPLQVATGVQTPATFHYQLGQPLFPPVGPLDKKESIS